jgi:hypothetical protein
MQLGVKGATEKTEFESKRAGDDGGERSRYEWRR